MLSVQNAYETQTPCSGSSCTCPTTVGFAQNSTVYSCYTVASSAMPAQLTLQVPAASGKSILCYCTATKAERAFAQASVQTVGFSQSLTASPHSSSAQNAALVQGGTTLLSLATGAAVNYSGTDTVNSSVKSYRLCLPQDQTLSSAQGAAPHGCCCGGLQPSLQAASV